MHSYHYILFVLHGWSHGTHNLYPNGVQGLSNPSFGAAMQQQQQHQSGMNGFGGAGFGGASRAEDQHLSPVQRAVKDVSLSPEACSSTGITADFVSLPDLIKQTVHCVRVRLHVRAYLSVGVCMSHTCSHTHMTGGCIFHFIHSHSS